MATTDQPERPAHFIYDLEEKLAALKDIRLAAGYTQQQMADLLGITRQRIAQIEAGEWRKSQHIQAFIQLIRLLDLMQMQIIPEEDEE